MDSPPIVLTTDFGAADPYAGVMKGVILRISPGATVVDLTHQVQPQNVRQAAIILGASYRFFPTGSIHVAVVDPGVGTSRRAILVVTPAARFLAPDNGLLSFVLADYLDQPPREPGRVSLPPNVTAYHLTNPRYWLSPVSRTFHGRDVFAPVAAHLSMGVPLQELGQPVTDLVWLPLPPPVQQGSSIQGEVIYADHFGNLITNIPGLELENKSGVVVEIKGRRIDGLSLTFQAGDQGEGTLLALEGSFGYLEIAVRNGSAASVLSAGPGEEVWVTLSAPC